MILNSNNEYNGMNTIVWLYQSGLGVINAEITKITITAYFLTLRKNLGVTMPILVNKNIITGISNAMPQPNIRFVKLSI